MKRIIIVCSIVIFFAGCKEDSVQLKWKVSPGEKLIYKTRMEILKGESFISEENNIMMLAKKAMELKGDTFKMPIKANDFYSNVIEQNNAVQYFSILEPSTDAINLDVLGNRKRKIKTAKFPIPNVFPLESNFFSGKIDAKGNILNNDNPFMQNYIVNILFELPKKAVSVGDSWSLDIKLFDFSKKPAVNKVTFTDIEYAGDDAIAILDYHIKDAGNKSMVLGSIDYKGTAEFNITKGKWVDFKGTLVYSSVGFTEMKQTQRIELKEISETVYFDLLDKYKKANAGMSTNNVLTESNTEQKLKKKEKTNNIVKVSTNKLKNQKTDCPVIYGVQILATAKPLPLSSKKFIGLPYKIEEKYVSSEKKFKYKYIVGNECSKSEARRLKNKISRKGFSGAFIVQK